MFDASEVTHAHVDILTSLEQIASDIIRLHQMQLDIINMLPIAHQMKLCFGVYLSDTSTRKRKSKVEKTILQPSHN